MKKMIALLLVVCVMCSMLIVTASAAEPRSMMRVETVTKRAANVRKYPNTNSLVYGNLMRENLEHYYSYVQRLVLRNGWLGNGVL